MNDVPKINKKYFLLKSRKDTLGICAIWQHLHDNIYRLAWYSYPKPIFYSAERAQHYISLEKIFSGEYNWNESEIAGEYDTFEELVADNIDLFL